MPSDRYYKVSFSYMDTIQQEWVPRTEEVKAHNAAMAKRAIAASYPVGRVDMRHARSEIVKPNVLNVYRVYSDPSGADQQFVAAPSAEEAIERATLLHPDRAKAYWMPRMTPKLANRLLKC